MQFSLCHFLFSFLVLVIKKWWNIFYRNFLFHIQTTNMVLKTETEELWNTIIVVFVRFLSDVLSFLVKILSISTGIFFVFFFELFSFKKVEIAFFLEIKKNHNFQSTHDFDFTAVLLEILGIDIELKIKVVGTKDC